MTEPLRVLIVEDEAIILMQLQLLVEEAGHNVVGTAMSAREAIPLIDTRKPEVVLLDLQLQDGSSGFDVARAARRHDDVLTVFLTANFLKVSNQMEGAMAVIAKPFNDSTIECSMAYLEECAHRPPPMLDLPNGMHLSPEYAARYANMRLS